MASGGAKMEHRSSEQTTQTHRDRLSELFEQSVD
jgi:hypothetical protein